MVQANPGPYLKNNKSKKGCGYGSRVKGLPCTHMYKLIFKFSAMISLESIMK
jgi:hypothetical protein